MSAISVFPQSSLPQILTVWAQIYENWSLALTFLAYFTPGSPQNDIENGMAVLSYPISIRSLSCTESYVELTSHLFARATRN